MVRSTKLGAPVIASSAVTAAAVKPYSSYAAVAACRQVMDPLANAGTASISDPAISATPGARVRSIVTSPRHSGSRLRQTSSCSRGASHPMKLSVTSRTVQACPSTRRPPSYVPCHNAPSFSLATTSSVARQTSRGDTSGAAMTLTTSMPSSLNGLATATSPAASVLTMVCSPSLSTSIPSSSRHSFSDQRGSSTSAVAKTSSVSGLTATGNVLISPRVCSEAQRLRPAWSGIASSATASVVSSSTRDHAPRAVARVGCGAESSSPASAAASSQEVPIVSASVVRRVPEATGARCASSSHSPAYDTAGAVAVST